MAGFFEVKDLATRKRALVAESEIYRETLKLETQNLRLYSLAFGRRWSVMSRAVPALLAAAPLLRRFYRGGRPSKLGLFGKLFAGWRLYRQFGPLVNAFLAQRSVRKMRVERAASQQLRSS